MELSTNPEMTLDEVIASLDADCECMLPVEALREAQRRREEITPHLIELIRTATEGAKQGTRPTREGHFFALFLLTEFRAKEAWPAIIEAISLPGDLPFDLFGDAITGDLIVTLAALAPDPPAPVLDSPIQNRELNVYVRWAAASAFVCLVRDEVITREQAVQRLQELLRDANIQMDCDVAGFLVHVLTDLGPVESFDDIKEAFRRELIDPFMIHLDDVEMACRNPDRSLQRAIQRLGPIGRPDTVEVLSKWAAFAPKPEPTPKSALSPGAAPPVAQKSASHSTSVSAPRLPESSSDKPFRYGNARTRVGRNEPCPCGSGKKFKKCCGVSK